METSCFVLDFQLTFERFCDFLLSDKHFVDGKKTFDLTLKTNNKYAWMEYPLDFPH